MGGLVTVLEMSWPEANHFLLNGEGEDIELDGFLVRRDSMRYQVFRRSRTCCCCGRVGTVMKLQYHRGSNQNRAHFNLYDESGRLFTKDHIISRSLGGGNGIRNLQTMCQKCNSRKGSMTPEEWANATELHTRLRGR